MRVSLDSNVWEKVVASDELACQAVRTAIASGKIATFVCEAVFRIEAVQKRARKGYFSQPAFAVQTPGDVVEIDGRPHLRIMSFGPDDDEHPGLPDMQARHFRAALDMGIKLMRGMAWMGLPSPLELRDLTTFVPETESERDGRTQRQIAVSAEIWKRGVGKEAFDQAGGWQAFHGGQLSEKKGG